MFVKIEIVEPDFKPVEVTLRIESQKELDDILAGDAEIRKEIGDIVVEDLRQLPALHNCSAWCPGCTICCPPSAVSEARKEAIARGYGSPDPVAEHVKCTG